ncbi:hypothetical protein D3C79_780610 [compost metagenome]
MLEDHRYLPAQCTLVGCTHGVNPGHLQLAGIGLGQPVHAAQQGRFAGAGLAEDHHEFTGLNIQVDAAQYRVVGVALGQLADTDHFRLRRSRSSTLAVSRTTL